jgi:glucan phosphoethanolaminetransferase (alkaline phosphatase superfamily)
MFDGKGEMRMSPALMKMWISFVAMGFMVISVLTVYFTRFKVKNNVIRIILNTIAFLLIIVAGLIIFYVVFSGPVPEST